MQKKFFILLIAFSMLLAIAGCSAKHEDIQEGTSISADSSAVVPEQASKVITSTIKEIKKHGNVVLEISFDDMTNNGMNIGDIITVSVGDAKFDMPVGTDYSDVDSGNMICRFDQDKKEVVIATNMGSFAESAGIGEKKEIAEDPGYSWTILIPEIRLQLKEKEGYLDEYRARNLSRTDLREDYPDLTDAEFANFRAISVSGIKENLIYRSSSPLRPDMGRNTYAMAAMEAAGIRSVINLDDSSEHMLSYSTYPDSYYSKCHILNSEMSYDFESEDFAAKVKNCLLFISENDGPYLIHCKEGKDRTGILCALIECFAGASAEEVTNDYMVTYQNFYHITPEDNTYNIVLKNNLVKTLCKLFQVDDLETADLKEKAAAYFRSAGLTEEQLSSLREKLK